MHAQSKQLSLESFEVIEMEEEAGHDLPWQPAEEFDDFDTWAERVLSASGFGVAALEMD